MSFVNLNEVFLPATGGTVNGDVGVEGAMTVNTGNGDGTTYDVAAEIAELKSAWDSVSQEASTAKSVPSDLNNIENGLFAYTTGTENTPTDYGIVIQFSTASNSWIFQLAFATYQSNGEKNMMFVRRNISNEAGWTGWGQIISA